MDRLLTQNEVADVLAISPKSVRALRKAGKIKAYTQFTNYGYTNRKYYKQSEISRYIDEELEPVERGE